ncbi:MAG TPA: choice-of-anchor L domain-containing protein, partial [Terriglobia bacterium]|nr:choice-of-anchor L domain-containing protein [Terriglobia bacterium]
MRFQRILPHHRYWSILASLALLAAMTPRAWGADQTQKDQGATPEASGSQPLTRAPRRQRARPEDPTKTQTPDAPPSPDASTTHAAVASAPRKQGEGAVASIGICPLYTTMGCSLAWKQPINSESPIVEIIPLTNTGTVAMNIQSISTVAPFSESDNCIAQSPLAPGATCNISVSVATTQLCEYDDQELTIVDDAGKQTVDMSVYGADQTLTVTDLNNPTLTVADLANTILGPGVVASNIKFTGAPIAAGTFTGGANVIGFDSGIILSDGSANNVIGPNCDSGITGINEQPGDTDLSNLIDDVTNDAAVLEFDFVPQASTLTFQYVWASDEYNQYVYQFNDVFGFFVNGTNIALVPGTDVPVSINDVNDGNPLGTNPTNPQFYLNNDFQYPTLAPFDTEMNGLTVVLTAQATVNPGVINHIKLAVADAIDFILDSNVFIKAASISSSQITLSPGTLGFGSQGLGTTSPSQTVTVTNNGETAVTISNISASGDFAATNVNCPLSPSTLASAGTCSITVTFTPLASGLLNGAVTLTDNASGVAGSTQTVTLSGTGTGAGPLAGVSPPSLTFSSQGVGTTSGSQPVTLSNTGNGALTISSIATSANFGQTNTCEGSVAAGGSCTIFVTFTPTDTGAFTGA